MPTIKGYGLDVAVKPVWRELGRTYGASSRVSAPGGSTPEWAACIRAALLPLLHRLLPPVPSFLEPKAPGCPRYPHAFLEGLFSVLEGLEFARLGGC